MSTSIPNRTALIKAVVAIIDSDFVGEDDVESLLTRMEGEGLRVVPVTPTNAMLAPLAGYQGAASKWLDIVAASPYAPPHA